MAAKQKRKLEDLSMDEFLLSGFDSPDEDGSEEETHSPQKKDATSTSPNKSEKKRGRASQHKHQLSKLKNKDPDFYKFLQDNDQSLLNFDDTDSSEDEDEKTYHKLPSVLEASSDDDDEEGQKSSRKSKKTVETIKVTIKMIEEWKTALKTHPVPRTFREVTQAFKAAIATTMGEGGGQCRYKVADSSVFNALVLFCIKDLYMILQKMLNLKPSKDQNKPVFPSSSSKWHRNLTDIKMYLSGVVQLLSSLTEASVVGAVLKHANQLVLYYLCLPKQCRHLIKQLLKQWSTGEEMSRVLAFLALNKISRHKQKTYLNSILKQMYISYVQNCKFTSPNMLPMVNFMQRTLTEMYSLDTQATYQHGFIYIRQLAIHLRNAMTMKKKETYQSVYNWQYIHCLYLWSRVLSTLHPSDVLQPLIYPLCQVVIGTIKLVPTAKYYPLRMHCCRALTLLSSSTNTFVPVLPFLLEIFQQVDFNKKPGRMSKKPINFAVILKLNKVNLMEKAYKDGLMDQLYDLMLEYFHSQASSISFPELALPTVIQLKAFLKECKVANYSKPMRQLLDKVQENSNYITAQRQKATFGVADTAVVWEKRIKEEGTPLSRYHSQWKKLREKEIQLEISGKERMEDLDLPEIKRRKIQDKKIEDKKEFKDLFQSDSSSDEENGGLKIKGEFTLYHMFKTQRASVEINMKTETNYKSKAPKPMSSADLIKLAEGQEDVVEDLQLSDDE
uniref:NOC2-like nucleolar associated transcriptional repressor n=1 Tax=Oryzias sinensis TaxID=183150 RepID=A0A8C7ZYN7_9TELE